MNLAGVGHGFYAGRSRVFVSLLVADSASREQMIFWLWAAAVCLGGIFELRGGVSDPCVIVGAAVTIRGAKHERRRPYVPCTFAGYPVHVNDFISDGSMESPFFRITRRISKGPMSSNNP